MKAVIMAGGAGSRLRPLTCGRPKPMTPVLNKPVMEYAIELLKKYDIIDIGVTLQYLPDEIKDYFGSGSEWGVNLSYFTEDIPLGTAGSVKNAEDFLDEPFIVVSGDALTDFDLSKALSFHRRAHAAATLVLTAVDAPLEYGVVITENDGKVRRFLEKPGWGEVFSDQVNTGIYILEPEVLKLIPPKTMFDFSKDLFPKLLEQRAPLYGCLVDGFWCDIGDIEQYKEAQFAMLGGRVHLPVSGKLIGDNIRVGEKTSISSSAVIEGPVLVGDNCFIGDGVKIEPYTVIGPNVVIEDAVSIKRSIIWENSYIGKNSELRGTVLCKNVRVGSNVSIYEGSTVGDKSEIKDLSTVSPDVKIWPYKVLEKGTNINSSLVWGTKGKKTLFSKYGIPGIMNLDITPEFAARIGGALGSCIGKGDTILISADGQFGSEIIKLALISGLISTGINVYDTGALMVPASRYAAKTLPVEFGIHLKKDNEDRDKMWMQFMDDKGVNISRNMERKIENRFNREDFRRTKDMDLGWYKRNGQVIGSYIDDLVGSVDAETVWNVSPKIVIYSEGNLVSSVLAQILERIGCRAVYYDDGEVNYSKTINREKLRRYVYQRIKSENADFGAVIDIHGEQLNLIDRQGKYIADDLYTVLTALIIFKSQDKGRVAVPVTAPSIIEKIAEQYNGQVIRTKASPQDFMIKAMDENGGTLQSGYAQFYLQYDAVYALVKILEFTVLKSIPLSDLLENIPEYNLMRKSVHCPWEVKGRVMRRLIDEEEKESVELLDGMKVYHEDGWALVLPDAEEPVYNIYSEAYSQEAAESLTDLYLNKINNYIEEN